MLKTQVTVFFLNVDFSLINFQLTGLYMYLKNYIVILTASKELFWTEFLTDFQNVGIKIFRKARGLIKKILKNFRRGSWGPKMTKNRKNGVLFLPNFPFFAIFWSFRYPLKILVFFGESIVYSKNFGILLLKIKQKLKFSQLFFKEKTLKMFFFALRPKMAEILNRYLD